jgi:hypothetical protein
MKVQELIFVYNADSGIWNGTLDVMHKVFSPSTYSCHLCKITYGALSVKSKWANFIKSLPVTTSFYHRDEFISKYNNSAQLPAVFLEENGKLEVFIPSEQMVKLDLTELQKLIVLQLEKTKI